VAVCRKPPHDWDFARFNPEFFRHYEKRLAQLRDLGVEADIILFATPHTLRDGARPRDHVRSGSASRVRTCRRRVANEDDVRLDAEVAQLREAFS